MVEYYAKVVTSILLQPTTQYMKSFTLLCNFKFTKSWQVILVISTCNGKHGIHSHSSQYCLLMLWLFFQTFSQGFVNLKLTDYKTSLPGYQNYQFLSTGNGRCGRFWQVENLYRSENSPLGREHLPFVIFKCKRNNWVATDQGLTIIRIAWSNDAYVLASHEIIWGQWLRER